MNRCPTINELVLAEVWYKKSVDYSKLKIFGSIAYLHVPEQKRSKLDEKAIKCEMLGYCGSGYLLLNLKYKKIVAGRDVVFVENNKCKDEESEKELNPIVALEDCNTNQMIQNDSDFEINEITCTVEDDDTSVCSSKDDEDQTRKSGRQTKGPNDLNDYKGYAYAMNDENISYTEAVKGCDSKLWKEAMKKNRVRNFLPKTEDMKVIDCKWILRIKKENEKEINKQD